MAAGPPNDSETAAAALRHAIAGDRSLVETVETISGQTLLRMACEVRQVASHAPRFSATTIAGISISPCCALSFQLDGAPGDTHTPSQVFFQQCRSQAAYRGFVFAVITAAEDHVNTLAVPPLVLTHRFALFNPTELIDFNLASMLMYLENCPRSHATPSLFVKISTWLGVMSRRTSPLERMRCLLIRSCQWMLNTLMFMVGVDPFDEKFVMPHWYMAKYLLANNPPSILTALFCAAPSGAFQLPCPISRTDSVAFAAEGILNTAWKADDFRASLIYWWMFVKTKRPLTALFYCIE
ncbi:tegument protein UL7 [Pteropodid alphaherpesvirus 1]|uniref:Tegument protein UL7 n=1 Tax=Pteropodid alphaherpesvirus 1 TaxID=1343901 RepID=A0A060Q591_9ALPH|nr:tegument protein UL7 [Pteropodid alphaherpesvirus 1]BAP00686.1 tegument protein UL7 [Pteropodid alphaherpesvirus 1]